MIWTFQSVCNFVSAYFWIILDGGKGGMGLCQCTNDFIFKEGINFDILTYIQLNNYPPYYMY